MNKKDVGDTLALLLFVLGIVMAAFAIGVTFGAGWGFTWLCACCVVGGVGVIVSVRR